MMILSRLMLTLTIYAAAALCSSYFLSHFGKLFRPEGKGGGGGGGSPLCNVCSTCGAKEYFFSRFGLK